MKTEHHPSSGRDKDTPWSTSTPTLAELGLDTVLKEGETAKDKEDPLGSIGTRTAPPGFRSICRELGGKYDMSFSRFVRLAMKHGAAILTADPVMKDLKKEYRQLRSDALDSGIPSALVRLDQPQAYDFSRPQPCHTTLSTIPWVRAHLSELTDITGIHVSKLAVIAILASMATLPNERGYRVLVMDELKEFWKTVRQRHLGLQIGSNLDDDVTP